MKLQRALATAIFLSLLNGMAAAACGPAFDGAWETRIIESQGQYTQSMFINNSKNGALHASTETGTIRSPSRDVIYGTILAMSYNELYKNLRAKPTSKTTCVLTFGKPRVDKDTYGVAGHTLARGATLSVSGRSIRWCWTRNGHQLGDCMLLRRDN